VSAKLFSALCTPLDLLYILHSRFDLNHFKNLIFKVSAMAPPSAQVDTASSQAIAWGQETPVIKTASSLFPKPLKYSGSLDSFEHFDVTAVIGRDFPKLQISQIIEDDVKIRDLAIIGENHLNVFDIDLLTDN
jgi:hypothetical protein